MSLSRIKNNQITDATITAAKLVNNTITAGKLEDNLTYGSNLTITGNLTVNGATTTVSTTNTTVEDAVMVLNSDATGAFANDVGVYMERGDNTSVFMGYDGSASQFALVETDSAGTVSAVNVTDYADLRLGGLTADDAITATGNVTGGNLITGAQVVATGNVTGGNLITGAQVVATGNVTGGNLITSALVSAGTVTATGNVTGGNLITSALVSAATVTATGNVTGGNLLTSALMSSATISTSGEATLASATVSDLTSGRVVLAGTSGAIEDSSNLTFDGSTLAVTGAATVSTTLGVTGNVTGGNLLTSALVSGGTVNSSGTMTATGNITGGNLITSALMSSATISTSGEATLASATVSDLTSGRVVLAGTSGAIEDSSNLTFNGSTLGVTGAITASTTVTATGNVVGGNVTTAGQVVATGNVTGGNLITSALVSAANVTASDTVTAGNLTVEAGATVEMNANTIGNVADPSSAQDAATKAYVDSVASSGFTITDGTTNQTIANGDTMTFAGTTDEVEVAVSATDTITIGLPQDVVIGRHLTVTGNLTVDGTTTTVNSVTSTLQDPIFQVGRGADNAALSSDDAKDRGMSMYYYEGSEKVAFMGFETTDNKFIFIPDATIAGEVVSGTAGPAEFGALTTASTSATGNVSGGNLISSALTSTATLSTSGEATLASAIVSDLTSGRVVLAGTSGALEDSTNLTFNGSTLAVTGAGTYSTTLGVTGNITGGNLITSALVSGGTVNSSGTMTATGNITGGNLLTSALVQGGSLTVLASGTIEMNENVVGNIGTPVAGSDAATKQYVDDALSSVFTITDGTTNQTIADGDTLTFAGTANEVEVAVSATDTVTIGLPDDVTLGGGLTATTTVSATGNVTGGNLITSALVSGATVNSSGTMTATGNITGGNLLTAGLVSAGTTVTATGNVVGGNLVTSALVSAADVSASATITATGNITGGNLLTAGVLETASITETATDVVINEAGADVNFRVESDNNANMLFIDAGTDTVNIGTGTPTTDVSFKVGTADSMMPPIGNTAQRPSSAVVGMVRFNTTLDSLEQYSSADGWEAVGALVFTVIASETFDGDNSTVAFTLSDSQTTASCIVSINGVVQLPTTAYGVSGTTLTFTEAPLSGDKIEVRKITTTQTITNISSASGGATVEANNEEEIDIKGNLMPAADSTYSIGNSTVRWTDIYVDAGSIYLGDVTLKSSGGTLQVFGSDGTTPAPTEVTSITKGGTDGVGNIGQSDNAFNTVFATATSAQYADLAEKYEADAEYEPGTVVMFGGDAEVTLCGDDHCSKVAGVVSTDPAYRMNDGLEAEHTAMVALTGRVPCKVTGPVAKGDMMVSAGNGHARAEANPKVGSVIGKALEDWEGGEGVIEVVVGKH